MPTTQLTIDNELLTANALSHLKDARAMRDKPYIATDHALTVGLEEQSGGYRVVVPYETEDHSRPTRVRTGYEGWDNYAAPTLTPGTERWGHVVQPVFISRRDKLQNRGEAQIIKLWETRVANVRRHMHRDFERVMFRGAAASNTWGGIEQYLDFLTLNGDDSTTGLLEGQADGTNTLHGITKATYPLATHRQFHNVWFDGAGSQSANLLNGLYRICVDLIVKGGPINASEIKGYMSDNVAVGLKRALRAAEQYVDKADMDDGGRTVMKYMGIPLTITDELPDTGATTNTDPWSVVLVNWKKGINIIGMSDAVMKFHPVQDIPLTGVQAGAFELMAQFVGRQPGLCGLLTDCEVW